MHKIKLATFVTLTSMLYFSCSSQESRKPITNNTGSYISEIAERNKLLFEKEIKEIKDVVKKDSTNNYIKSKFGFWYTYKSKSINDSSPTPEFGDNVNFTYDVSDLEGNLIYSKKDIDTLNYVMDKEILFKGMREGLKIMKEGENVTFLFPSEKAYGYYGDQNKIKSNIPLICNVTLNSINKIEN